MFQAQYRSRLEELDPGSRFDQPAPDASPIRRIREDEIEWPKGHQVVPKSEDVTPPHLARSKAGPRHIRGYRLQRPPVALHEHGSAGSPAQGLKSEGPGSREEIEDRRTSEMGGEDRKEALLHPVCRRPGGQALRSRKRCPPRRAGDDPYEGSPLLEERNPRPGLGRWAVRTS